MLQRFFNVLLATFSLSFGPSEVQDNLRKEQTISSEANQEQWADSVLLSLNQDQKIGQLFMVAAYSNKNEDHYSEIDKLVSQYNIGGLIFFQGGPVRQAILTNRYQSKAQVPLFIAMDAEWGLGMRLDSVMSYPKQMALGAIADDKYIYRMGADIAKQCKRLGVHINFAPVVDVNSNPANPIIGVRSFGEDKVNVANKGVAYMKGLQDNKIMANAKHFPGHGDSETDSHLSLPIINQSK
jgi:beta-glucosidase-like glycosyl hydrolase